MRAAQIKMSIAVTIVMIMVASRTLTLTADPSLTLPLIFTAMTIGGVGLGIRLFTSNRHAGWVWLVQLLAAIAIVVLPQLHLINSTLVKETQELIKVGMAPLPHSAGISILLMCLVAVLCLFMEWFVFVGRTAGASILPLLSWYLIFVFLPTPPQSKITCIVAVAGYLFILAVDTSNRGKGWQRHISDAGLQPLRELDSWVSRTAFIGIVGSIALAFIFTSIFSAFTPRSGRFPGTPGSLGDIALVDPRLDLKQNAVQPEIREILRYETISLDTPVSDDKGVRLKIATLDDFTNKGWQIRSGKPDKEFDATMTHQFSDIPGMKNPPKAERKTSIQIMNFNSQYLPLPYAPRTLTVQGRWATDPSTLMVFSPEGNSSNATSMRSYQVSSVDVEPTKDQLMTVTTGEPPSGTLSVPAEVPDSVRQLALQIAGQEPTAAEKASALQNYLRSPRFTYDLKSGPTKSSSIENLQEFLLVSHTGYCEQFAASMAVLARVLNIPSQVVIGTLPGKKTGSSFVVTNRDVHAWVELYFKDWGWVMFDPTPADVSGAPPTYSSSHTPSVDDKPKPPKPTSATPTTETSSKPTTSSTSPTTTAKPAKENSWLKILPQLLSWIGLGALVLIVLLTPMLLRNFIRRSRLSDTNEQQEIFALWQELRDTVIDHGIDWPIDSPRTIASSLADQFSPSTTEKIEKLSLAVEQARFATQVEVALPDQTSLIDAVVKELASQADLPTRILAKLLPKSLIKNTLRRVTAGF